MAIVKSSSIFNIITYILLYKNSLCKSYHEYANNELMAIQMVHVTRSACAYCKYFVSAVVISLYEEPIQPQQAASVVEKLGDYLITCGY